MHKWLKWHIFKKNKKMKDLSNDLGGLAPFVFYETVRDEVEQCKHIYSRTSSVRKNNRRNTSGRYTQYVHGVDDSQFPPKLYTKCIKHARR